MSFQWVFPPSSIIRFITNINNILTLKERYNFHMHPKNYFETRILQILLLSYLESRGPIVRLWNGGIAIDRLGVETIGGGGAVIRAVGTLFVEEKWRGGERVSHGTLSPAGKEQETAIVDTPPWVNVALGQRQESAPGTVPAWRTGGEWKWTRTSRSRINKSCCCLPFHLSSTSRSRPESYEIFPPPSGSR